jgi:hypothetical protein
VEPIAEKFKTPERIRVANRKWRKEHPEEFAAYCTAYAHRHPNRRMWSVAKQRARKYGVEFSIDPSDIVIPPVCPVFGFPLRSGVGRSKGPGGNDDSPSLDRIDPSKGYVKGNVRVISHMANSMKRGATGEQLLQFAEWIRRTA